MKNATYTVALDGTMTIIHATCGRTQIVPPIAVDEESGYAYFGSNADFCLACESEDKPSALAKETA
jgi:hypothetical protein